jgi:hypothetical protein
MAGCATSRTSGRSISLRMEIHEVKERRSRDQLVLRGASQSPNKQLQRTVTRRRGRAASAPFHALAARWTARRAAAQLRR